MFFRILHAPPGYPHEKQYLVAIYRTLDYDSSESWVTNDAGSKFFSTIEEARRVIPSNARQLPFEPEDQFVELWEAPDHQR